MTGPISALCKSLAHRVILVWGFPRFVLAFAAGAVGALAMAPFDILPALVVSLTLAVWLLDGAAAGSDRFSMAALRAAGFTGWAFGFGYHTAGLWWLGSAFLVEADQFAWLMPLGVLGLPAALGLFTGLGFVLARLLWKPGAQRVLALAVGLGLSEWLRGNVFTGFPWNSYGMGLGDHLWLAQAASIVGLNGLTLFAVAICAAPACIGTGRTGRERWLAPGLALLAVVALAGFGERRLAAAPVENVPGVKLRIMQPNIPQDDKFRPENAPAIMRRYLELSQRSAGPASPGMADITHLIWPESAFPFLLAREPAALAQISGLLDRKAILITGAVRASEPLPGENGRRFYNAIQVVGPDGSILDSADKVHLVPFGEYLPFSDFLTSLGLRQFVPAPGGFEAGTHRKLLNVPGLPAAAPLICYEAIFPGEVLPSIGHARLFINLTNDAWFGVTPGPHQHLAQARLRTIEEGIPLIRAANSGISAVIDPYGRVLGSLPLGTDGVLDANLPEPIEFTVFGNLSRHLWILILILFSIALAFPLRRI